MYGLTTNGITCQAALRIKLNLVPREHLFPDLAWDVYGSVCYRHRAIVLRNLREPLNPSAVRRLVRKYNPQARISVNNVRDVLQEFLRRGLVREVALNGEFRPAYELTELGVNLRHFLLRSEEPA